MPDAPDNMGQDEKKNQSIIALAPTTSSLRTAALGASVNENRRTRIGLQKVGERE